MTYQIYPIEERCIFLREQNIKFEVVGTGLQEWVIIEGLDAENLFELGREFERWLARKGVKTL